MNKEIIEQLQNISKTYILIYDRIKDTFNWDKSFENLIEGEIRNDNDLVDILFSSNDSFINKDYKITTIKGNIKHISIITKEFNEKEYYFITDISEKIFENEQLNRLYTTLQDAQNATNLSVHYMDSEGNYFWTPEVYNIIDRKPRKSDKYHHIILDLFTRENRKKIEKLLDNLEPNEYLGNFTTTITTESGKTKYIQINSRQIYDDEGNFIQRSGYVQDITEQIFLEKDKKLLNHIIAIVLKHLKIGVFTIDLNGKKELSEGFLEITGLEKDREDEFFIEILNFLKNGGEEYEKTFEYKHPKSNKRKYLTIYLVPYNYENNKIYIGAIQDVTSKIEKENALIKADEEKTILIKEIHHRVKNNLQVITSFISLEERFHKNSPERIIEVTKNRINSLALIHERIYNEENMNFISFKDFINDFDCRLFNLTSKNIKFINKIPEELSLAIDIMIPIVLIINELTINSFKYAFNDNNNHIIYKSMTKENDNYLFTYCDNGSGLSENFDIESSSGLGWTIIKALSNQLDGKIKIESKKGFKFKLKFK